MLIKSDVHIHTTFCDGKSSMEDMVKAAVASGMDTVGISFHSYTDFDRSYCIKDYPAYMRELLRLRREYSGKIYILGGVELDLYGELPPEYDYTIGSVHYLRAGDSYIPVDDSAEKFIEGVNEFFGGDVYAACERYYEEVEELADGISPNIYGHFDLITRFNGENKLFDEGNPRYKAAALSAVENLPAGAVVEVNLGRLNRYGGGIYPSDWLIREMVLRGCRFMLSSDAHTASGVGAGFDEACAKLRRLGVRSLVRFMGDRLVRVEI